MEIVRSASYTTLQEKSWTQTASSLNRNRTEFLAILLKDFGGRGGGCQRRWHVSREVEIVSYYCDGKQRAVEAPCMIFETSGVSTEQLVTGHRELSLKLTRKLLCWGAFRASEGAMYLWEKRHQWSFSALDLAYYNTDLPGKCTNRCYRGIAVRMGNQTLSG